ncbi:MAG: DUF2752 domain-containing protein [Akkermansiaceae bacterium]|nr:DUF2752 domain-containing protein [Akkermansiaceae bacterium]
MLLGVAAVVVASIYLYHHSPTDGGSIYPRCTLRELTGLDCAGCGVTRASHELLHLRIGKAVSYNPLVVLAAPFLIVWIGVELAAWLFAERYRGPRMRMGKRSGIAMVTIILLYSVLRNIPVWPLTLLAPG